MALSANQVAALVGAGVIVTGQGGGLPNPGYFFMRAQQPDGSYVTLSILNADGSRSNLQGKAA